MKKSDDRTRRSRRRFLGAAAGAAGGALLIPEQVLGQTQRTAALTPVPAATPAKAEAASIQISPDFTKSLTTPSLRRDFTSDGGITGAQIFANLCKDEGLAALFCVPGNYSVINAIAQVGIPCYGGRNESSMASAADGFYRVTGEVTACSGTEGPGFMASLLGVASAAGARTPLLLLVSNQTIAQEDSQRGSQFIYQQPVTESIRKYGKRIITPNRVYEYGANAFRELKTGVPGLVHLDFPGEVAGARYTDASTLECFYPKDHYRSESVPSPSEAEVGKAIDLINRAERPLVIAGHGVFHRKAWEPLLRAAERHEFAVVASGPMKGHFPESHRLSMQTAQSALMSADLVVFIGQYVMPTTEDWTLAPGIKTIRVHPEVSDLGRNWPLELGIVSDERLFLEALAGRIPQKTRPAWVAEIAASKQKFEQQLAEYHALGLKYSRDTNSLHPAVIAKELDDFLYKGAIDPKQTVMGLGGSTMRAYTGRYFRAHRPGQQVAVSYQFGAMGPDMAMMLGATAAVQRGVGPQAPYKGAPVFAVTGDGGVGYSLLELDTAARYKLPLITIVYSNNAWGTFTSTGNTPQALHMYLMQDNVRYDKVAEGFGVRGEYTRTPEELRAAIKRAYDGAVKDGSPALIVAQGIKEFTVARLYPPGLANTEPGLASNHH